MDTEGSRPTPPDANTSPASSIDPPGSISNEGRGSLPRVEPRGTPAPDNAITETSQSAYPSLPRPNPWRRPVELVALVVWGILLLLAILWPKDSYVRMRSSRNAANQAALSALTRALEAYAADYGTYPSRAEGSLVNDTTFFIQCLQTKGARGQPYYVFRDEDIVKGVFQSDFDKPFRYTFPARGKPGPDGVIHNTVDYYIWTWGWSGFFSRDSSDSPIEWGVNNWSR
jgi:type II secretory pathway pseudopilin PulG